MGRTELYNHNQIYLHRSCNTTCITPITFLPLLCRLSTQDAVKISEPKNDPSSPKVGCMGQIKRHNNNKINNTTTGKLKYTQLKKMFSGRNLLVTTTTSSTNTNTNTGAYCKVGNNNKKIDTSVHRRPKFHNHGHGSCAVVVPLNLAELDPPLPVPCGLGKGGEKESLWKRRGGVAPIQPIQLPYNNTALLPPSSVS